MGNTDTHKNKKMENIKNQMKRQLKSALKTEADQAAKEEIVRRIVALDSSKDAGKDQKAEVAPKHLPKPEYCKCNAGHELVEVYNERYNKFDWDCPICIRKMKEAK